MTAKKPIKPRENRPKASEADPCCSCNFDLLRMKKAVEGPFYILPNNLTREEMRWYICAVRDLDIPEGLSGEQLTAFAKEQYKKYKEEELEKALRNGKLII